MELKARLSKARKRLLLQVFMRHLAAALGGALLTAGLILLLAAWQQWSVPLQLLLLAVPGAAVLAAVVLTLLSDTSYLRAARILEAADPTLHAKLTTALELTEQSGANDSPVRRAQLQSALNAADRLNEAADIAVRPHSGLLTLLLSGSAVLAGSLFLQGPVSQLQQPAASVSSAPAAELSQDEQANLASSLQQLAEIFAPDEHGKTNDAYMEAISRQLQELGTRLEGEQLTREQLTSELERLLQHTRTALELNEGADTGTAQADLTQLLEAALREVRQPAETVAADAPEADDPAQAAAPDSGPTAAPDGSTEASAAQQPPSLQDLLADGNEPQDSSNQGRGSGQQVQERTGSYYDQAIDERTIAELNARAMEQALSQGAGEAIGASEQSQEGASSLAGDGTDELFGSEAAQQLNAQRIEQLSLAEETDPEGRHVRIEVNPEAEFTEVFETPLGATAWSRSTEAEVLREALLTDQRLVTARYHTPEQAE